MLNSQTRYDKKPPVSVKGTKEGLLFILDEQCEFEELEIYVTHLLGGESSGLFDGPKVNVFVDYGSRLLSAEESRALLSVFLNKSNFLIREWSAQTSVRRGMFANHSASKQVIHKGTVRAGQTLNVDGDVVIIGDVNPGGVVIASGDVYVFGRLRGIAHAGASGNMEAIIAAAEFSPMQLRIASTITRSPEVNGKPLNTFMEFAYLRDDGMAVDKMQYVPTLQREVKN